MRFCARSYRAAAFLPIVALLSGCGGGGGSASGDSLSLSPSSVSASYYGGNSYTFQETATFQGTVSGNVYVLIVDSVGVINASVPITAQSDGTYLATISTRSDLPVGNHQGSLQVQVCGDPGCSQQYASTSLPYNFDVQAYPLPTLRSISPNSVVADGPAFTLTATGSNFAPAAAGGASASVVLLNGTPLPTTYVSATEITATVSSATINNGGNLAVTVSNPAPGGGVSNAVNLAVSNPAPQLGFLNESSATAGCGAFGLYVLGSNFVQSSTVLWNGASRPTTFVSPSVLLARIQAGDVAAAGSATVTVSNPAPGGGGSAPAGFAVGSSGLPVSDAVAFQINPGHSGAATSPCPVNLPAQSLWNAGMASPSYALIAGGKVFAVDTGSQQLSALDSTNGTAVWGPVSVPNLYSGGYDSNSVFVNAGGTVEAFDAASGTLQWSTALGGGSYLSASGPVAAGGIVALDPGVVVALSESTGALLWNQQTSGTQGTPAVTADGVYINPACEVADYSPASGNPVWAQNFGCDGGGGSVAIVANGLMYATETYPPGGGIFNAQSGARIASGYSPTFPAAFTSDMGFFTGNGSLTGVRLSDNTTLWTFVANGTLATAPIVVNQTVFIAATDQANNGVIYALDSRTGQLLAQTRLSAPVNLPGPYTNWAVGTAPSLQAGGGLLVVPTANSLAAYAISSR